MSSRFSLRKFGVASMLLGLLACGTADAPLGPSPKPELGLIDGLLGAVVGTVVTLAKDVLGILLPCSPQPNVTVVQNVGAAGGTIYFGKHSLVIPRGALSQTVTITAQAFPTAGNSVSFSPEGLKFAVPATLRLNYGNCQSGTKPKAIVYTDDNLKIISKFNSLDYPSSQKVQTDLQHFSRYAVAW